MLLMCLTQSCQPPLTCQVCHHLASEPSTCAGCGRYGHAECLRLENFFNYLFCEVCIPSVTSEYASFQDARRREEWRRSLTTQISTWRTRAIEAIGVSSSIGVAVGGVVAAAAGVAASLAQGTVRGIVETTASSQAPLPPPPASIALKDSTDLQAVAMPQVPLPLHRD